MNATLLIDDTLSVSAVNKDGKHFDKGKLLNFLY